MDVSVIAAQRLGCRRGALPASAGRPGRESGPPGPIAGAPTLYPVPSKISARWATVAALGALAALPLLAPAAEPTATGADEPRSRPRIGLVLGGGGAKGAAHIGVIKVLEELRIPVDCIAGTSMGSIVGAAYATGMSASQLEQIITAVDWKNILATAPREDIPLQRKRLDFAFTNGLEVGIKDGDLVLPGGLVPTHQVEAMFRRILAGAGKVSEFDRLPIPFRAVATNLENGQMHVFDHGDLAVAMRASMAVPGAFAPVESEGKLLVDGMLVRNLPVDVARQVCADVVIAVPVSNPAISRDRLGLLTSVIGQAMNIAVEANEKAQLATLGPRDVNIPVILQNVSSSDFAKVPEAIPIGEAAAREARASLSRYSLPPDQYAAWRAGLGEVTALPKVKIDEVRMAGFKVTNPEVMRTFVQTQPGELYDPERADADSTRIAARGDFTAVAPALTEEAGLNVLTYRAVEKPWGPDYLLFDLNLSTDLQGKTGWGIRVDYEKRWLNALGGELRTTFQLGSPNVLSAEFYQPLDVQQRFFVAPSAFARQKLYSFFSGDEAVGELDELRYGVRLEAGATLGTSGEARLGLVFGRVHEDVSVGLPWFTDPGESAVGALRLGLRHDSLDKRTFPSRGTTALFGAEASDTGLGADRDYRRASLEAGHVMTFGPNVLTLGLRGGTSFDTNVPYYDQFKLGGLFKFSGYKMDQLVGREYALASVQYRHRLGYLMETLGSDTWGGFSLETGNVYQRADGTPASGVMSGGSIYVGVNSRLGPVYLGYGRFEGGRHAVYLYIGSSLEAF